MQQTKWARWGLGAAALVIVIGSLTLLLAPRAVEVEAAEARLAPFTEAVADQGVARVREAYVVSAPVAGRLSRLTLHVGDPVIADQTVIAEIRPSSVALLDPRTRAQAEAAVAAARAAQATAEAQMAEAAARARKAAGDLVRVRTLQERGVASRQALDNAEAEARVARAAVQAAGAQNQQRRAELAAARSALLGPEASGQGLVIVRSPASGRLTRVIQEDAGELAAGAPILEVSDQAGLEAAIEFLSQDAVRIAEGMPAEIYGWGGPGAIPAVVRRVEPQGFTKVSALGVEEQRVRVLLQLTGPPQAWTRLGPGYRLWGRVFLRREARGLVAPLGALVRDGEGWAVYRIRDGRARLTPIRVGAMTDREVEVLAGLSPGDRLVAFPSDKVRDGVRVKAMPTGRS